MLVPVHQEGGGDRTLSSISCHLIERAVEHPVHSVGVTIKGATLVRLLLSTGRETQVQITIGGNHA